MSISDNQQTPVPFSPHTGRVKAGATLVFIGGFLGAVGSMLAGVEFAVATRRWLREQGRPPSEIARVRARQAFEAGQAASRAAAAVWSGSGNGGADARTGSEASHS